MNHCRRWIAACAAAVLFAGCSTPASNTSDRQAESRSESLSNTQESEQTELLSANESNLASDPAVLVSEDRAQSVQSAALDESEPAKQDSYSVSDVLSQADQLIGQDITVIGNLPQSLIEDENGSLIMAVADDEGNRLQIEGDVNIGGCRAALHGRLIRKDGVPVLEVESIEQL